jgi:Glycosyltransferase
MRVFQVAPALDVNDAVSNEIININRYLKAFGLDARIFALHTAPLLESYVSPAGSLADSVDQDTVIIYHYSLHSPISDMLKVLKNNRKMLIYHNVTPPEFFIAYDSSLYRLCLEGRERLKEMAEDYDLACGDSEYNRRELEQAGFARTGIIPLVIDFTRFGRANRQLLERLSEDGTTNIIFTGRLSPNKKQDDIIRSFYYYNKYINGNSRLYLVGREQVSRYVSELKTLTRSLQLGDRVIMTGAVSDSDLTAYYQGSHCFVCMSEHEGFCAPLLEAMSFRLPVIAYNSSGVSDTLGSAGVLINRKRYAEIAEMINLLNGDEALREQILSGQDERLQDFSMEKIGPMLMKYLDSLQDHP